MPRQWTSLIFVLALLLMPALASAQSPQACPANAMEFAPGAPPVTCRCGEPGGAPVWGSGPYTADSDLCRAARHAGRIGPQGGQITFERGGAVPRFSGSRRNGVASEDYGEYPHSMNFQGALVAGAEAVPDGVAACGNTMEAEHGNKEPVRCHCTADAVAHGASVWGTDAYTTDSATCRAALHAGAVGARGGIVTMRVLGGLPRYVGLTRNGVISQNYGPWGNSFRFEGLNSGPQLCPDNMTAYAGGTETLECVCTGEAVLRPGTVWGIGPYTADSATCRAARHAGVVPVTGGNVTVAMMGGAPRWPTSIRNGITTTEWGEYPAGFRFEGAQNVAATAPVQAPVADSLRRTGRVSLYINFRTNSADLDPAARPVLEQLRDALAADAGLNLRIIGHTDNQGTPQLNTPLSQRRAQAVRAWLAANGIAEARLRAEGRGQGEPIADNATDAGRSLNRRVEAVRVD